MKRKTMTLPDEIVNLRSLPINARADVIIKMMQFAISEWAAMVSENVKPMPTRRLLGPATAQGEPRPAAGPRRCRG